MAVTLSVLANPADGWCDDVIVPGPGVTKVKRLSDYHPDLKGTLGDTRVFVLEGKEPGGTFLVFGGTHCDETAGLAAALMVVEHATVQKGRVIVIPQPNNSGWTNNHPQEAHPQFITIPQKAGPGRVFRFGSRMGNSGELWPDPEVFIQYPHRQKYSGEEIRNPNRAYPGRPDGTFQENVAYGIQMLHRKEHIDMQLDLHEGQPEYPFVNAVSSHKRAADVGSGAVLEMQMADLNIGMETSPDSFRGLSNLEMGDMFPHLYAFTSETMNPAQGKIRGITDEYPDRRRRRRLLRSGGAARLSVRTLAEGRQLARHAGRSEHAADPVVDHVARREQGHRDRLGRHPDLQGRDGERRRTLPQPGARGHRDARDPRSARLLEVSVEEPVPLRTAIREGARRLPDRPRPPSRGVPRATTTTAFGPIRTSRAGNER